MAAFHVVIVEDNRVELDMLSQVVKNLESAIVHAFDNAYDAFDFFMQPRDFELHLVLSDWEMPGMNGLALLNSFRTVNKHTPFYLITGNTDKTLVLESKRAGATGYIAKPYSTRRLLAKLETYKPTTA